MTISAFHECQRATAVMSTAAYILGWMVALETTFFFAPRVQAAEASESTSVAEVFAAWKTRQELVKSVHVNWKVDQANHYRFGTYRAAEPLPRGDEDSIRDDTLVIDGERLFVETTRWHRESNLEFSEFTHPHLTVESYYKSTFDKALGERFENPGEYRTEPKRLQIWFNGDLRTEFFTPLGNRGGRASATVSDRRTPSKGEYAYLDDLTYRALLLSFRPLSGLLGTVDEKNCVLKSFDSQVDARLCVVMSESISTDSPALSRTYWIDPSRDFVICRVIVTAENRPREQLDIRYRKDETFGWVPEWWNVMLFPSVQATKVRGYPGHPELFQYAAFQVVNLAINDPVKSAEIEPSLPAGTYVFDRRDNQTYVVEQDGGRRVLRDEEKSALTLGGEESTPARGQFVTWRPAAGIATVVIAAAIVMLRRRRRWKLSGRQTDEACKLPSDT